ncbi:glycosyltransferase family 2 protein [Rhizobacter sp. J219]|uniref:glycosyltransferase family 2 protein n=1 Tax=Rhizobacter sp. J219 TaxID=2898430 RepID=UPI002151B381|nr:glycosyltransferase family 2 protein [Rhizobacter sp. J219]MCR5883072.1 glycosyltransferase family 2 protein [Rhizobacter sp. J219]
MSATLQLYILCYNRAELARQAIQSALAQTEKRFQLVISDNSTDGKTKAMVEAEFPHVDYRFRDPHLKALDHFNLCLAEATADHVCLFHDDDLLAPRYVERVLAAVARHPGVAAIGVNAWIAEEGRPERLSFSTRGAEHPVRDAAQLASHYFARYQIGIAPFPGYVYARASVDGLRFDPAEGKYSDVMWLLRVVERGGMVWVVEPLMTYRLHAANDSRQESIGDRLRLMAYFKRHEPIVGGNLLEDFRFFVYKKALELDRARLRTLPPTRRETMMGYLKRYRCRRMGRFDQHLALLRRTRLRIAQRLGGSS